MNNSLETRVMGNDRRCWISDALTLWCLLIDVAFADENYDVNSLCQKNLGRD